MHMVWTIDMYPYGPDCSWNPYGLEQGFIWIGMQLSLWFCVVLFVMLPEFHDILCIHASLIISVFIVTTGKFYIA